jgi:hypothetical protein
MKMRNTGQKRREEPQPKGERGMTLEEEFLRDRKMSDI